jgi:tetratricopeptide (TPR) repeat protein
MIAEAPILGGMPRPPVGYEPNLRWAVAHALEPDVEPSAKLRLAGHPAGAVSAAREALDVANASGAVDDLALAQAWYATALASRADLAALDQAKLALAGRRPLGRTLTGELLTILAGTTDSGEALAVRLAQLDIARLVAGGHGETPEALRDLSIALNNAGRIHENHGNLDDALRYYSESVVVARRIHTDFGERPETLRDLSVALNNAGRIHENHGNLDDALALYTESLAMPVASAKLPRPSATSPSLWRTSPASKTSVAISTTRSPTTPKPSPSAAVSMLTTPNPSPAVSRTSTTSATSPSAWGPSRTIDMTTTTNSTWNFE